MHFCQTSSFLPYLGQQVRYPIKQTILWKRLRSHRFPFYVDPPSLSCKRTSSNDGSLAPEFVLNGFNVSHHWLQCRIDDGLGIIEIVHVIDFCPRQALRLGETNPGSALNWPIASLKNKFTWPSRSIDSILAKRRRPPREEKRAMFTKVPLSTEGSRILAWATARLYASVGSVLTGNRSVCVGPG